MNMNGLSSLRPACGALAASEKAKKKVARLEAIGFDGNGASVEI